MNNVLTTGDLMPYLMNNVLAKGNLMPYLMNNACIKSAKLLGNVAKLEKKIYKNEEVFKPVS